MTYAARQLVVDMFEAVARCLADSGCPLTEEQLSVLALVRAEQVAA